MVRWDRTIVYLGIILLLALIPLAMYRSYRGALAGLSSALSRGTGLSVTVNDLWVTGSPALVLHRVRVGSPGLELTADRLVLELDWAGVLGLFSGDGPGRTMVRGVRVRRPMVKVTSSGFARLVEEASTDSKAAPKGKPKKKPRPAGRGKSKRPPTRVIIEDGALIVGLGKGGRDLTLSSRGIYLKAASEGGPGRRLLLGQTTLHVAGKRLLDLPAAAVDLAPAGKGVLPVRMAAAGGQLDLLDHTFDVHLFHLTRKPAGYRVALKGATRDPERPGRITLEAKMDALHRPSSVSAALLQLEELSLERVAPLLNIKGLRAPDARVDGKVRIWREGGLARVQLKFSGEKIKVSHPLLARRPVGPFPASVVAAFTLDPAGRAVTLSRLDIATGKLTARLQGELKLQDPGASLALDLDVPETSCQTWLTTLPEGFAPVLKGAYLKGELGGRGRLRLHTDRLEEAEVDLSLTPLTCRMLVDPPGADVNQLNASLTVQVQGPGGTTRPWLLGSDNPDYLTYERLGANTRAAFVAGEDNRFHWHKGFDARQMRRAFILNLEAGRTMRGASTISQQLVKNVFLHHGRTLSRKFQEAVLTWRMEQRVPKQRILELYLNVVEMGVKLRGVTQAALHYFDKSPAHLTPLEAAHLAAITPFPRNPKDMVGPDGQPTSSWMERVHQLLRIMRRTRHLSDADVAGWTKTKLVLKNGPG